jgi:hypothetical protein
MDQEFRQYLIIGPASLLICELFLEMAPGTQKDHLPDRYKEFIMTITSSGSRDTEVGRCGWNSELCPWVELYRNKYLTHRATKGMR